MCNTVWHVYSICILVVLDVCKPAGLSAMSQISSRTTAMSVDLASTSASMSAMSTICLQCSGLCW